VRIITALKWSVNGMQNPKGTFSRPISAEVGLVSIFVRQVLTDVGERSIISSIHLINRINYFYETLEIMNAA